MSQIAMIFKLFWFMDCMNKKKILVIVSLMFVGLISLAYFVIASQAEDKLFIKKGWNLIFPGCIALRAPTLLSRG